VRVPVINYLRACPLPVAKEKLAELEKIDPAAVKRASTFFPIPTPAAPGKGDSSSLGRELQQTPTSPPALDLDGARSLEAYFAESNQKPAAGLIASIALDPPSLSLDISPPQKVSSLSLLFVILLGSSTLGLTMWMTLSGGSRRAL
jgi:hypothetical protein